jgi:hypothetical protein
VNLCGIVGRAGSGKDTIADILVRDHGYVKIALADPIKRTLREIYAFTDYQLWGSSSARNAPDPRYPRTETGEMFIASYEATHGFKRQAMVNEMMAFTYFERAVVKEFGLEFAKHFLTARHAAQQLGTEFGRACYDDTWIDLGLRTAAELLVGDKYRRVSYDGMRGLIPRVGPKEVRGVVFSDIRFPNEVRAVRENKGVLWKTTHGAGLSGAAGAHESESYIDSLAVDAVIPDSTLDALPMIVTTLLAAVQVTQGIRG